MATSSTWIKKLRPNPPKPEVVSEEEMLAAEGDCFMAALDLLGDRFWNGNDDEQEKWFCVHGLVRHPETLKFHWHAWCEYDKTYQVPFRRQPDSELEFMDVTLTSVHDNSNGQETETVKALYYKIGDIRCVRRWSIPETQQHMRESGHAGPWHEYDETELYEEE
jgi:hypothetical protein